MGLKSTTPGWTAADPRFLMIEASSITFVDADVISVDQVCVMLPRDGSSFGPIATGRMG